MSKIKLAVILAAGMGTRLVKITNNEIPKGFLEIENKSLVERSIEKLREQGIKKIYIVTGNLSGFYEELAEKNSDIITLRNNDFATTGSMTSLAVLKNHIKEDFILLESDIIYEKKALQSAIEFPEDTCVMLSGETKSGDEYYVELKNDKLYKASKNLDELEEVYGEWVGISKVSKKLFKEMVKCYDKKSYIRQYHYEDAIIDSAKSINIGYRKIKDLIWAEIDDENHLNRVKKYIVPKLLSKGEY